MRPIKLFLVAGTFALMTGCASLDSSSGTFAIQYGTMKTIEQSESIEASHVLYATERMRNAIEEDVSLSVSSLSSTFFSRVDISGLSPSDQLLVLTVVRNVQASIDERYESSNRFTREQEITLLELLDRIDEAAMTYK